MIVIISISVPLLVGGSLILYFVKNPDKFEKWLSILYKFFRFVCDKAEYKYVKYTVQSYINGFIVSIKKDVPNLNVENVKLGWVDGNTTADQFIKNDQLVLRMHKSRNDNRNVVHATVAFVSCALLHKAKRYIADYQKKTIDLFATTKILEEGHSEFLSDFVDLYLADAMDNDKINDMFSKFEDIHKVKMFFPVFVNELNFLGEKVFARSVRKQIVYDEVSSLCSFLYCYSNRKKSEDVQSDYTGQYARFAIRIVGKKGKIQNVGSSIYVKNIISIDDSVETIYLLGDLTNKTFIKGVVDDVIKIKPYHIYNHKEYKCTIKDSNGDDMPVNTYLVVLRSNTISTFKK